MKVRSLTAAFLTVAISTSLFAADNEADKQVAKDDSAGEVAKVASVSEKPRKEILAVSRKIDKLVEAACKENDVTLNARTSDEVFLRRVYLDIVGRIPTIDEATAFLDSDKKNKRSELIDTLLDSEGYVSHSYNYWADLLRIQTRNRYNPGQHYIEFVKTALRENRPYDQFVRELITAEGYTWDNGASGYYLRDVGMPLDNMSNTVQVFLGTQLVCAQCHNHPYDSWTQRQYYQLAAFTYGVETRDRNTPQALALRQMRRDRDVDRNTINAAGQILQQLNYRVNEIDRPLRLPKDYQYDDAKPGDAIDPKTIFGDEVEVNEGDSPADIYARWMTSPKNPRFSTVIANRLWKRAMGRGLVEPVDDFKDGIDAANPQLMTLLSEQIVGLNFDLKQYQRILFNTETYQREVTAREVLASDDFHFEGPLLRRMSAEQLWDSLLAATVPDLDERKGVVQTYSRGYPQGQELVDLPMKEVLAMAEKLGKQREAQFKFSQMSREMQEDLRVAYRTQDREKVAELREKMNDLRKEVLGKDGEMMYQMQRQQFSEQMRETDPRWQGVSRELVRASETSSPARPGHFLRQFGQSDRETIENASTEATVPQILTMLNGPMYYQLLNRASVLGKKITATRDPEEQAELIFLALLSRRPTDAELELASNQIQSNRSGYVDIVWALINTRQFMFIQ